MLIRRGLTLNASRNPNPHLQRNPLAFSLDLYSEVKKVNLTVPMLKLSHIARIGPSDCSRTCKVLRARVELSDRLMNLVENVCYWYKPNIISKSNLWLSVLDP